MTVNSIYLLAAFLSYSRIFSHHAAIISLHQNCFTFRIHARMYFIIVHSGLSSTLKFAQVKRFSHLISLTKAFAPSPVYYKLDSAKEINALQSSDVLPSWSARSNHGFRSPTFCPGLCSVFVWGQQNQGREAILAVVAVQHHPKVQHHQCNLGLSIAHCQNRHLLHHCHGRNIKWGSSSQSNKTWLTLWPQSWARHITSEWCVLPPRNRSMLCWLENSDHEIGFMRSVEPLCVLVLPRAAYSVIKDQA